MTSTTSSRCAAASAVAAGWALAAWPAQALGCPSCAAGKVARAAVLGPSFAGDLAALLAPFAVVAAAAVALYRIGLPPRPRAGSDRR